MSDAHKHSEGAHGHSQGAHEKTDIEPGPMLWIIPVSIVVVVLFVTVIVYLSAAAASDEMTAKQYGTADAGKGQLLALRAHEDSLLASAGTDTAGHGRIPIERAMETLANRRGNAATSPATP